MRITFPRTHLSRIGWLRKAVAVLIAVVGWSSACRADNPRFVADFNADGRADVAFIAEDGVYVSLSDGRGSFGADKKWLAHYFTEANGWDDPALIRVAGDVNGDRRADIVGFGGAGVFVAISSGTKFADPVLWTSNFGTDEGWTIDQHVREIRDVNGDGKDDIVACSAGAVACALSDGRSFGEFQWLKKDLYSPDLLSNSKKNGTLLTFSDVNGDKKTDLVTFDKDKVYANYGTGSGFLGFLQLRYPNGQKLTGLQRAIGDADGDGKAEFLFFTANGVQVLSQNAQPRLWSNNFGTTAGWVSNSLVRTVGDVNGDRLADVVGFGIADVIVATSDRSNFVNPASWGGKRFANDNWKSSATVAATTTSRSKPPAGSAPSMIKSSAVWFSDKQMNVSAFRPASPSAKPVTAFAASTLGYYIPEFEEPNLEVRGTGNNKLNLLEVPDGDSNRYWEKGGGWNVPRQFYFQKAVLTEASSTIDFFSSSSERRSSFSAKLGLEGGAFGTTVGVEGRLSGTKSETQGSKKSFIRGEKLAARYWLVLNKKVAGLDREFREYLLNDRNFQSPQNWDAFFKQYGTHYPLAVLYGGKSFYESEMTGESMEKASSQSWGVSANASTTIAGVDVAATASYDQSVAEGRSTNKEVTKRKAVNFGGTSATSGDGVDGWQLGDDDTNLVPVNVQLEGIWNLVRPEYFPGVDPNRVRNRQTEMQRQLIRLLTGKLPPPPQPDRKKRHFVIRVMAKYGKNRGYPLASSTATIMKGGEALKDEASGIRTIPNDYVLVEEKRPGHAGRRNSTWYYLTVYDHPAYPVDKLNTDRYAFVLRNSQHRNTRAIYFPNDRATIPQGNRGTLSSDFFSDSSTKSEPIWGSNWFNFKVKGGGVGEVVIHVFERKVNVDDSSPTKKANEKVQAGLRPPYTRR